MPFNVNEFTSNVNAAGGPALTSNFDVSIFAPTAIRELYASRMNDMRFRIEAIDFPSRSIAPISNVYHGPAYKFGGQATYIDITMTILLSSDLRERDVMMAWQDVLIGTSRKTSGLGATLANGQRVGYPRDQFDCGYYKDYIGSLEINQYAGTLVPNYSTDSNFIDKIGSAFIPAIAGGGVFGGPGKKKEVAKPLYTIQLVDAFPTSVQGIAANWAAPEIARMQVTWTYRYFKEKHVAATGAAVSEDSFFTKLNKSGAGGAIGTLGGVLAGKIGSKATTGIFAGATILGKFL
jgi:hypothetical protein